MATRVLAFYALCILLCSLHGAVTARPSPSRSLHLRYFAHEVRGGPNTTLIAAAGPGQGNLSLDAVTWGTFVVVDNLMKPSKDPNSQLLGTIEGFDVVTTKEGFAAGGAQVRAEHKFGQASPYNGSSLTVSGTILTPNPPYECIVPGGTGFFRGYSGYAIISTVRNGPVPPVYVFRWDVYITKN